MCTPPILLPVPLVWGGCPCYPQFNQNSTELAEQAADAVARGEVQTPAEFVARGLNSDEIQFSVEDIDNPVNWPRTLMLWRNNLLGSSAKGEEYFLKHLLGTHNNVMSEDEVNSKPREVKWHDHAPEGKLDLLVTANFRMTSSTLSSDVVFPAATWYEKFDISSTDMHPYIHAFSPAIDPPLGD